MAISCVVTLINIAKAVFLIMAPDLKGNRLVFFFFSALPMIELMENSYKPVQQTQLEKGFG